LMDPIADLILPALVTYGWRLLAAGVFLAIMYFVMKALTSILRYMLRGVEAQYVARIMEVVKVGLYVLIAIVTAAIIAPEVQVFTVLVLLIGLILTVMFFDVLRNLGAELFVRTRNLVRRGEWVEVDGTLVRVVELESLGVIGETARMERVFIPYTKLLSSGILSRSTPAGLSLRITVMAPSSYRLDTVREAIRSAVEAVKPDLATEPDITFAGSQEDRWVFTVDLFVWNPKKMWRIVEEVEKRIREQIPEASVKA